MPTCPGCARAVPHGRLDVHQRYCRELWGLAPEDGRPIERLDRRIEVLERRLDRRLRDLESDLDRQLTETETETGTEGLWDRSGRR